MAALKFRKYKMTRRQHNSKRLFNASLYWRTLLLRASLHDAPRVFTEEEAEALLHFFDRPTKPNSKEQKAA